MANCNMGHHQNTEKQQDWAQALRGGYNDNPQSMFWSKNKENRYNPAYPSFSILKWGLRGYILHGHVFLMTSGFEGVRL